MNGDEEVFRAQLRTMQIIALALPAGAFAFLVVVLIVGANDPAAAAPGQASLLTWLAAGLLAVNAVVASIVPESQTRSALQRIASGEWRPPAGSPPQAFATDTARLLAVRQTALLIALALLESSAFLGCIVYLMEKNPALLAVPVAALALMLVRFPTAGRVRAWLEQQQQRLASLRQEADSSTRPESAQ